MFDNLLKNSELCGMQLNKIISFNNNILNIRLFYILLLITSLLYVLSCKKEKKDTAPIISYSFPQSNLTLNAIDSVRIKANISDDYGPLIVSVYIINDQMKTFTQPLVKTFSGSEINIDEFYFFNNMYFETGIYYIVIRAEDGNNTVNEFIKVNIVEIPKVLNSIYVGIEDLNGVKIFCNDTLGNFNEIGYISSTIISACVNSYTKQMSVLTYDGNFITYSIPDFQVTWQKSGLTTPGHLFKGETKVYENFTYVNDANGYIYGYDYLGNVRNINSIEDGVPISFNFCNNNILTFVEYDFYNSYSIQQLYPNGGLISKYQINFQPFKILPSSSISTTIWGKSQNNTQMYTYYTEINNLQTFGSLINENFNDVVVTPDNKYLLSAGNNLMTIEKTYGNTMVYASGNRADFMKFESLSNSLYTADSNIMSVYNYPNSSKINSYTFLGKILFFDFFYNK
jgi:hypothetical protein